MFQGAQYFVFELLGALGPALDVALIHEYATSTLCAVFIRQRRTLAIEQVVHQHTHVRVHAFGHDLGAWHVTHDHQRAFDARREQLR